MNKEKETCRIELSLTNGKVPVRKLEDLPKLLDVELFKFLKMKKDPFSVNENKVEKRGLINFLRFKLRLFAAGFNQAKKEFNQSKNFEKTLGKYFKESKLDLEKVAKRKLRNYFKK